MNFIATKESVEIKRKEEARHRIEDGFCHTSEDEELERLERINGQEEDKSQHKHTQTHS